MEVTGLHSRVSEFNTAIANILVQLECSSVLGPVNKCLADICLQIIHTSESWAYGLYLPHPDCVYEQLPQHFVVWGRVAE